jgi:hypothetical protein
MSIAEVVEELLAEVPKKALAKVSGSVCGSWRKLAQALTEGRRGKQKH